MTFKQVLSIVQALNAGRYLLFVVFFMSALVGIGAHTIMVKYPPTRTCALLLILILLDLGPTTFQHPYQAGDSGDPELIMSDTHFDSFQKEIQDIPPDELPNFRIFYITNQTYRALVISWFAIYLNQPSIYPLYNEHTLSYTAFTQPFETLAAPPLIGLKHQEDLLSQPLANEIFKAFYLLNIQHVLISQPEQNKALKWRLPKVKPIVVAPRAVPLALPLSGPNTPDLLQTWPRIIQAMGPINEQAGSCDQIPLADSSAPEDLHTTPAVEVLKHHVWNQRVELTVDISSPCYARLAYAYYPYLTVTVDGKPVQPFQTAGRFISLRLDKGKHDIVITPYLSPLRKTLLILNLGWIGLALGMRWRRRA